MFDINKFPQDLKMLYDVWQMSKQNRDYALRDIKDLEDIENKNLIQHELLVQSMNLLKERTQQYCDNGVKFLNKLSEYEKQGVKLY